MRSALGDDVQQNRAAPQLREKARQPSGAGAELENRQPGLQPQAVEQRRQIRQDRPACRRAC